MSALVWPWPCTHIPWRRAARWPWVRGSVPPAQDAPHALEETPVLALRCIVANRHHVMNGSFHLRLVQVAGIRQSNALDLIIRIIAVNVAVLTLARVACSRCYNIGTVRIVAAVDTSTSVCIYA